MKLVLTVEDSAEVRMLIALELRADPRLDIVAEADSATVAIDTARRHQPDVIVLDHFIHGDTMGIQAARLLKEAAPDTRILLFTEHNLAVEAAREPAIDAYLEKTGLAQLLSVVQELASLVAQD